MTRAVALAAAAALLLTGCTGPWGPPRADRVAASLTECDRTRTEVTARLACYRDVYDADADERMSP